RSNGGLGRAQLGQRARVAEPAADLETASGPAIHQLGQPPRVAPLDPVTLVEEEPAPRRRACVNVRFVLVGLHRLERSWQEVPYAVGGGEGPAAAGTVRASLERPHGLGAVRATEPNGRA